MLLKTIVLIHPSRPSRWHARPRVRLAEAEHLALRNLQQMVLLVLFSQLPSELLPQTRLETIDFIVAFVNTEPAADNLGLVGSHPTIPCVVGLMKVLHRSLKESRPFFALTVQYTVDDPHQPQSRTSTLQHVYRSRPPNFLQPIGRLRVLA